VKRGVFITCDVECSMGGAWGREDLKPVPASRAIMGEYGNRKLGLPLICDILGQHGLAATFFVEPFHEEQGYPGQMEPVCQYLLDRGQDVQLHIHPNHKHYGLKQAGKHFPFTDQLAELEPQAQQALLAEGCDRVERWTGRRPVAFRAGNMAADERSLEQMAAVGIRIDSSYTFPYLGGQCRFREEQRYNGSKWYGDVLELALSGFCQPRLPALHAAKPLDLVGISFEECRGAIEQIHAAGADAVIILHSFSLFKVRNVQYDGGRLNWIVARRFRRLCRWLADKADEYPTYTFAQLAEAIDAGRYEAKAVPPCKLNHPLRALTRKAVQAVNRLYWV
jgi:hypothetical protein